MRRQRTIRFSDNLEKSIQEAFHERGFASPTVFIRRAAEQELLGRKENLTGAEERLAASIQQVRHDQFRLMPMQQALFAYVDTLTKTILTCVPEPPAEARAEARGPKNATTAC